MRVLGIDEAGRGCVLGDLVIAGFVTDDPDEVTLRTAGAADSKAVSPKRRNAAKQALQALGAVEIRRISPREIDQANLNHLEEAAIVHIITAVRPDVVQIDALGHPSTLPALLRRLRAQLPEDLSPRWTIEPKADSTFAVVGAASIFAKTLRDELLDGWRSEFGEFGSGYPSDPKTRAWITAWAETRKPWPEFVRTRWATISELSQPRLV
jgi:ribonuclease HII